MLFCRFFVDLLLGCWGARLAALGLLCRLGSKRERNPALEPEPEPDPAPEPEPEPALGPAPGRAVVTLVAAIMGASASVL